MRLDIGCPVERTDGRAGGRVGGVRSRDCQNFWVDLLTHGAPPARFARQSSAIMKSFFFLSVATSSPGRFSLALEVGREKLGKSALGTRLDVVSVCSSSLFRPGTHCCPAKNHYNNK